MNILLTGAISLSNKGTAAIVISTINNLKRTFPKSNIHIELFYPEKQKEIIDLEKRYGVVITAPLLQSPLKAIYLFLATFMMSHLRLFRIKPPHIRGLEAYEYADIIIDISAEAFVKYYDDDIIQMITRFLGHLYPILIGLFLEKSIILLAQTLAPFGIFKPIMKYVIKKSALVTVRDPISIENLKKEGIGVSKIHLTADPAFLLNAAPHDRVCEILRLEEINIDILKYRGKKILGICAARAIGRVLKVGEYEKNIKTLAGTADILIKECNVTVIFIPHSSGKIREESDDVMVGMDIMNYVRNKEEFYLMRGDYTPHELKGIIGKLDCLISLRMHPVIFAISVGIPSIIIAFSDKAYGVMKMFELDNNVIHINKIQENLLIDSIKKCLDKSQYLKKIIESKLPQVQEKALMNFKILGRYYTKEAKMRIYGTSNKNTKNSWGKLYSKSTHKLLKKSPLEIRRLNQALIRYIPSKSLVLDVGCGKGGLLSFNASWTLVGMDISTSLLKIASNNYRASLFIAGSATKLPFKDETFDAVVFVAVLHHLPKDINFALKEASRVLCPNGIIFIQEPNKYSYQPLILGANAPLKIWGKLQDPKEYPIDPKEIVQMLQRLGMETHYEGVNIFPLRLLARFPMPVATIIDWFDRVITHIFRPLYFGPGNFRIVAKKSIR